MRYAKYPFLVIPYLMRNPKSFPHFRGDKYFNGFPSPISRGQAFTGMTLVLAEPVLARPSRDRQAVARNEVKLIILHISLKKI